MLFVPLLLLSGALSSANGQPPVGDAEPPPPPDSGPPISPPENLGPSVASVLAPCQLPPPADPLQVNAGFPIHSGYAPKIGTYNAVVLFIDFIDAPAVSSTADVFAANWGATEGYLETLSGGLLDFQATPHHSWVRLNLPYSHYGQGSDALRIQLMRDAVVAADPTVDFNGADSIWLMLSDGLNVDTGWAWYTPFEPFVADGSSVHTAIAKSNYGIAPVPGLAEAVTAHEIMHTLGLPDLYAYPPPGVNPTPQFSFQYIGDIDPMGYRNTRELLAWSRWQLGWLTNERIECITTYPTTTTLVPAQAAGGTHAMVVQLSATSALVVEARASARFDDDLFFGGVLAYVVDSSLPTGQGPIRLAGDPVFLWPTELDLLMPGEELIYEDYRITVGAGFSVTISELAYCNDLLATHDMKLLGVTAITGTTGDDVIVGTASADTIVGAGGNDTICGEEGADVLWGGEGDDLIIGGPDDDILLGGGGVDDLFGNNGNDQIWGFDGDDDLFGGNGDDILQGMDGNDTMLGGSGTNTFIGHDGDDTMFGGAEVDVIWGLGGDDRMFGGAGNDVLLGNEGNDYGEGGYGIDWVLGHDGNDWLLGGPDGDLVWGGPGNDTLGGQGGDDFVVAGEEGDDSVDGGDGNDLLLGDNVGLPPGNDTMTGGNGDDVLWGFDGDDTLNGGPGNDTLLGGAGANDVCNGDADIDATDGSCELESGIP
ncbi:MAG: hypothetical protein AAF567_15170 [Actinomycetota bacterium]